MKKRYDRKLVPLFSYSDQAFETQTFRRYGLLILN